MHTAQTLSDLAAFVRRMLADGHAVAFRPASTPTEGLTGEVAFTHVPGSWAELYYFLYWLTRQSGDMEEVCARYGLEWEWGLDPDADLERLWGKCKAAYGRECTEEDLYRYGCQTLAEKLPYFDLYLAPHPERPGLMAVAWEPMFAVYSPAPWRAAEDALRLARAVGAPWVQVLAAEPIAPYPLRRDVHGDWHVRPLGPAVAAPVEVFAQFAASAPALG